MKKEIISNIEALLKEEDFTQTQPKIRELRAQYNEAERVAEEEARKKFLEDGGEESDFVSTRDEDDKRFMELMTVFNNKRKQLDEQRKQEEEVNYKEKLSLMDELKKLIEEETNISRAFLKQKELKRRWEEVGNVPKDKFKELQHDFSLQMEYFYYNMNIYKTLKSYDLEKNLKIKQGLIEKMKALADVKSIKEVKEQVETLIKEWDETGPTFQEQWQKVRDEFWESAAIVHKKIKDHYAELKDQQKQNLEKKQSICNQVEEILKQELTQEKHWRKSTDEILDLQKEWKKIGFATKKQNDKIWEQFRSLLDQFFAAKKEFFGQLKSVHGELEKKKVSLIEKAEKLKDQTTWKETTAAFIQLQKQWKAIGHTGAQKESRLWKRFNAAGNAFFEAKKEYYATLDDRMASNLKEKNKIIEQVKAFKASGEKGKDLEALKAFNIAWNDVGIIAKDKAGAANKEFNAALDSHYNGLGLKGKEKERTKFKARVEVFKGSKNADELLQNERRKLKDQIRKLESEVVQYENNLGFFANSKGDNPLLKMAEDKVAGAKEELEQLRERLKLV